MQSWTGGTPSSPGWGVSHSVLDEGIPSSPGQGMGNPIQSWMEVPLGSPPSRPGMGYPLPGQLDGVPPPPKREWTDSCENITSRHPSDGGGKYAGDAVKDLILKASVNGLKCFLNNPMVAWHQKQMIFWFSPARHEGRFSKGVFSTILIKEFLFAACLQFVKPLHSFQKLN